VYHKNKCLIINVMLSDVNLHYLTLAARCPVRGCWPSCSQQTWAKIGEGQGLCPCGAGAVPLWRWVSI